MRVLWLFGNGLDISLGLKTSYYDFYQFLLTLEVKGLISENNIIYKQLKRDFEHNKQDLWSDYELRLGNLTNQISEEDITRFTDDKIEIDLLLSDYLKSEEQKLNIEKDKVYEVLTNSFSEIVNCSRRIDNDIVIKLIESNYNSNFYFKAISFNYTKTVSLLWSEELKELKELKNFRIKDYPNTDHSCLLENPFYLHGTLDDGEMIIGVNDTSQIINSKLKDNEELGDVLIKTNLLNNAGQLHFEEFCNIVSNSSIICLYGLSIGKTDSRYWKYLKYRMIDTSAILIIYHYRKDFTANHIAQKNRIIKEVKNNFYLNSNATDNEIKNIRNRIIVEINHQLFINE